MTDEKKAEEILTDYLKQSASFLSDIVDEDMARDLIKIGLAEGRKENEKLKEKLKKVQNYLAYEIPHDLMNEATKKIYKMV